MTDDEFDQEVEAAAEGRWEDLGLDAPDTDAPPPGFEPQSVQEFLDGADT